MSISAPKRRSRIRLWTAAVIVAIAAVIGAILVPATAQAAPVELSGVISGASGAHLGSVKVTALELDDLGNATVAATVVSSAKGAFSFAALPADWYTLAFAATATTFAQYLGNTSDLAQAQTLTFDSGGGNHYYVNASLSAGGKLSGTVKTSANHAINGYTLRAYSRNAAGKWTISRTATTSSSGSYSISGLEPADYRVEALNTSGATSTYAPAFSGEATDLEDATSVGVIAGKTTTSNFTLGKSGSVAGVVTGHFGSTTENLSGVRVSVYRLTGTTPTTAAALDAPSAVTGGAGSYTISGLAPGTYTLEFSPRTSAPFSPSGQEYGRNFLGNADTALGATTFQVVDGTAVIGRDIQLLPGATVEGHVLESENLAVGIPDLRVTIDYLGSDPDDASEHAQTTLTDADGDYTFTGLGAGSYQEYIGSNVDQDPGDGITEDTNRVRQIVPLQNGPLTPGETDFEGAQAELKVPGGIYPTVNPSITDLAAQHVIGVSELAVLPGAWDEPIDFSQDVRYQWLRDGAPITGATGLTYTPTPGDVYAELSAKIIIDSFAYGKYTYLVPEVGPMLPGDLQANPPYITGDDRVGHTVSANVGAWSQPGVTLRYAWQSSQNGTTWNPVGGADGFTASHTLTPQDLLLGPHIRVEVTGSREGFNDLTVDSDDLTISDGQIVSDSPPKVTKTATGFTISAGGWTPSGFDTSTVTWTAYQANGSSVDYVEPTLPLAGTAGLYVTAYIKHTAFGYSDGYTDIVTAQLGSAAIPSGSSALVGTPAYGSTLSAPSVTWTPSGDTPTHQWQYKSGSSWKNLAGATGSSYTPVIGDIGRLLRVVTTETKSGYQNATLVSTASVAVASGAAPTNTVAASYSGNAGTLATVTADPGTWSSPASFTYQWKYSTSGSAPYTKVSNGTHAQYTIPNSLYAKHLFVDVTASPTAPKHVPATVTVNLGLVGHGLLSAGKALKLTHTGNLYTASGATWSPTPDSIGYSWYTGDGTDAPVLAHNGATFTVPAGDADAHVTVRAQADLVGYSSTFTPYVLVQKGNLVPATTITLSGGAVGAPVTPSTIGWGVTGVSLKYSWQYLSGATWKSISGATKSVYTPTPGYLGKQLRVRVTASRANYNSATATSSPVTVSLGAAPTPSSLLFPPGIDGYDAVGNTMTAVPGAWSLSGVTFSYQWELSPDNITWTHVDGATKSTFVIPDAAYNTDYIGLVITATKSGYTPGTFGLATTGRAVSGQLTTTKQPKVATSHAALTVSAGTWNVAAPTISYEWDVMDPATDAATIVSTTSSYTPIAADSGKEITATVTAAFPHYNQNSRTLIAQTGATIGPITPLSLTGTTAVDSVLTANWVDWTTANPFVSVRWYRNGVLIPGQFNATYTQIAADLGKTVTARITVSKDGYAGATYTLASDVTQSDVVPAASIDPTISGTSAVGSTLTAHPGTWNVSGLTFAYRWYRNNGVAIPGATASSYLLTPLDAHQDISVVVMASKPFYPSATVASASVTVEAGTTLALIGGVTIASTGAIGTAIHPSIGSWNLPATITYQWYQSAAPFTSWSFVSGATSPDYTPSVDDGLNSGMELELEITASRPGQAVTYAQSNELTIS